MTDSLSCDIIFSNLVYVGSPLFEGTLPRLGSFLWVEKRRAILEICMSLVVAHDVLF